MRWYRCVRCDSWLPLPPPGSAGARDARRRARRSSCRCAARRCATEIVLRIIAIDRAHPLRRARRCSPSPSSCSPAHEVRVRDAFYRVVERRAGDERHAGAALTAHGFLHYDRAHLLAQVVDALRRRGGVPRLRGARGRRGGRALVPEALGRVPDVRRDDPLPAATRSTSSAGGLAVQGRSRSSINVAIAVYLLYAKRLFGLRGGGGAEARERARDVGWEALSAPRRRGRNTRSTSLGASASARS